MTRRAQVAATAVVLVLAGACGGTPATEPRGFQAGEEGAPEATATAVGETFDDPTVGSGLLIADVAEGVRPYQLWLAADGDTPCAVMGVVGEQVLARECDTDLLEVGDSAPISYQLLNAADQPAALVGLTVDAVAEVRLISEREGRITVPTVDVDLPVVEPVAPVNAFAAPLPGGVVDVAGPIIALDADGNVIARTEL